MEHEVAHRVEREVAIQSGGATLSGSVSVPENARGIVLFAHGSGSSRHSPRNVFVARALQDAGLGTLLFDLLTSAEENIDLYTREHRFDIALLAERMVDATHWLDTQPELRDLDVGYFGAARAALPRWLQRRSSEIASARSSRAAAVPTSPVPPCRT
jgi:hypothetical protein